MTTNSHKIGDTFDYSDQLEMFINGVIVSDFSGMTGASQLRSLDGDLIAELEFTWLDATLGLYRISSVGSTAGWPVSVVKHDIQLTTAAGAIISTETELVKLSEDITHG